MTSFNGASSWCHLAAAACPGISCAFIGTPFEVIKTRLQTQHEGLTTQFRGPLGCLRGTLRDEGPRALWRGLVPTVCTSVPYSIVVFSAYEALRPSDGNLPGCVLAGSISGLVVTLPQNPLEILRVRLQAQGTETLSNILRSLAQKPKEAFNGMGMTSCINVVGNGLMFSLNEGLRKVLANRGNLGLPAPAADAITGGLTGLSFKLLLYPADLIRSRVMASKVSSRDVIQAALKESPLGLYRGASVVVLKACLTNTVGWTMLHATKRFLGLAER